MFLLRIDLVRGKTSATFGNDNNKIFRPSGGCPGWRREGNVARLRTLVVSTLVVALGAGGAWYALQPSEPVRARAATPIPVTVNAVSKRDLPIYLIGLGTVQAKFTVNIRTMVDGKLESVQFVEGQHVKKGDLLAKIYPPAYQAALDGATAKKAQDEANLISAEKDLTRAKTLVIRSFETQQNVDQTQAKVDAYKASIKADEAAIEAAQVNLNFTNIVAPSDGRMGVRLIDPGNILHPADNATIAMLTLAKPCAVMFTLSARSLGDVREAMARGPVEVEALSEDGRRVLSKGTLLLIDNIVDQTSATMHLKAMFDNEDEQLWPGDFVKARLLLENRHEVVAVPSTAIQRGPDGIFVWVVTDQDTVETRKITSGPSAGDQTIVTSGLTEGERVVVDGQYKLQQNSKVQVLGPASAEASPQPPQP